MFDYYYLISSLPYLLFGKKSMISSDFFMQECEKWLGNEDLSIIKRIDLNGLQDYPDDPPALKEWKKFNGVLRDDLAHVRTALKENPGDKPKTSFREIFEQPTPLLMEETYEKIRWDFIEQTEPNYIYDLSTLILYFIKLKILERLAVFDKYKGAEKFDRLISEKVSLL